MVPAVAHPFVAVSRSLKLASVKSPRTQLWAPQAAVLVEPFVDGTV